MTVPSTPPELSSTENRDETAERRDRTAQERDLRAAVRDRSASERDLAAEERDRSAEEREALPVDPRRLEQGDVQRGNPPERRTTQEGGRRKVDSQNAADRAHAASDRQASSSSRLGGARDRTSALDDREAASGDRDDAAKDRDVSTLDELTDTYRRGPGLVELERELARAKRTSHPFVVAFVDVDGLKATNDSRGHAAGDILLLQVVRAIRDQLRSYDLIVRFGGDEFVCGVLDLDLPTTTDRFAQAHAALTDGASFTVGLAALGADDSLSELMARADEELYAKRSLRASTRA